MVSDDNADAPNDTASTPKSPKSTEGKRKQPKVIQQPPKGTGGESKPRQHASTLDDNAIGLMRDAVRQGLYG